MTTEAALLAAIAANPDDDLPRLVYADWLDENGQPIRAEFIRLQIEIAKKETLPRAAVNAFAYLWQRQQEILDGHREELLGPLAGVRVSNIEFRRGFADSITLPAEEFVAASGKAIAALQPTPGTVRVTEVARTLQQTVRVSQAVLHVITGLSFPLSDTESADAGPRLNASILRLRSSYPRVRVLDFENCRIGDAAVGNLFVPPPCFPALVDLDLSFNDLTDAGVIVLLNTGLPQRLKRLVLGGNPIGDQAAMELADRLGRSTVLETLNLRMTNIGRAGQAAITRAFGSRADLF